MILSFRPQGEIFRLLGNKNIIKARFLALLEMTIIKGFLK